MRTMEVSLESDRCDEEALKKQLLMMEGVVEVKYDVENNIAYLKMSDDCKCRKDDVLCAVRDLAYNVNS